MGSTLLEGRHPHPSVSHPSSVLGLWDVPACAPFKTSPRGHQVTLGRDWQEADLHEGPAPTHGSGRHQKARGPHHPAQEAEEAASQECPHHGLDGASDRAPRCRLRGGFSDCDPGAGDVTSSNYPGWFQQTPGQPPRTVIYSTNSRPTGVPSRFSGAISGNKATLTITGAQAEDEADYFCALEKSGATATVM
uniref:Ig-like domain-containing protein n=1 Tax=Sus scrofa TaxID=9823 RepID=A0A8D0R0H5_PIG